MLKKQRFAKKNQMREVIINQGLEVMDIFEETLYVPSEEREDSGRFYC